MAITIDTTPTAVHFTGIPIVFAVSSDRDGTETSGSVGLANNGGFCQYTYTSHPFIADDIVTMSGYTATALNVRQTVTSDDGANTFTTDLAWASVYTGDSGTVTRSNDNFQVRADVTINSVTTTIRQYAISGAFTFNIAKILSAQLSSNPVAVTNVKPVNDTSSFKSYSVLFTEEFDDVDGLLQEGQDQTSGTLYATLGTRQYADTQTTADYLTSYASVKYPLTDGYFTGAAKTIQMQRDGYAQASFLFDGSAAGITLFKAYVNDGDAVTESAPTTISGTYKKIVIPVAPSMWTDAGDETALSVSLYGFYSGSYRNLGGVIMTLKNKPDHGKNVWWRNSLGAWDTFVFTTSVSEEITTEREEYEKDLGTSYTVGDRGRDVLDTTSKTKVMATSHPLNDDQMEWLKTLQNSKDVRILDGTTFLPVVMKTTSNTTKTTEGLQRFVIEYELAYDER